MFSRFATPKNFSCVHTLDMKSNVQSMFSANVQSFCQGFNLQVWADWLIDLMGVFFV